jgi:hypothetical protein
VQFFSTASISDCITAHHAPRCSSGSRLAVVARKMQLHLQIMRGQSRHRLVAEKVLHCTISQRLTVVVHVDALLIMGKRSSELHWVLDTSWCWS